MSKPEAVKWFPEEFAFSNTSNSCKLTLGVNLKALLPPTKIHLCYQWHKLQPNYSLINWQLDLFEFQEHRCEMVVKRIDFYFYFIFSFIRFSFYFAVTNALLLITYDHNMVSQQTQAGNTLQTRVEISIEHQVENNGSLLMKISL